MPKRRLRIVKSSPLPIIGVCEACSQQFKSHNPETDKGEWEISIEFSNHECKPLDSSQNALRIVLEAPENK